jgi:hypothetical protein
MGRNAKASNPLPPVAAKAYRELIPLALAAGVSVKRGGVFLSDSVWEVGWLRPTL